ncbi:nitrilase-related carbon-nitrogen hydrolase, partial [Parasphingorhabdus sp.]
MRIALAQMCSGIDPHENSLTLRSNIDEASKGRADILFTPEMTGIVDRDRARAAPNICSEQDDPVLAEAQAGAVRNKIWLCLGSLALRPDEAVDDKWVNRSFLINPDGDIVARYDKIHLFDVDLETGESWRESSAYSGGTQAVVAPVGTAALGMSVCYDIRFSRLYSALAYGGATVISIPAAFTVPTGEAHWAVLLRARAIECAAFVVAAAQCGKHQDGRETYGHS